MALPLICPPQSAAPLDENAVLFGDSKLLGRLWYLFFHAIADALTKTGFTLANGANILHVTPAGVSISHLSAAASASLTCSTAYADVVDATLTLDRRGDYIVTAVCDISVDSGASQVLCQLEQDGVAIAAPVANLATSAGEIRGTVVQHWTVTNTRAVSLLQLQGRKTVNAGSGIVFADHTVLKAMYVG